MATVDLRTEAKQILDKLFFVFIAIAFCLWLSPPEVHAESDRHIRNGSSPIAAVLMLSWPDFDDNGTVDFADFLLFVQHFGSSEEKFDLDSNGKVDFSDFLLFVSHFGKKPPHLAYNIELVFFEGFTSHQKNVIKKAARRWEEVIVDDVRDMDFSQDSFAQSVLTDQGIFTSIIDDIVIVVETEYLGDFIYGLGGQGAQVYGSPEVERASGLPYVGEITINNLDEVLNDDAVLFQVALHEMGHALGIGTLTERHLIVETAEGKTTDAYFPGPLTVKAFNAIGGEGYTGGGKVPMATESALYLPPWGIGAHWRGSVFGNELMSDGDWERGRLSPLSIVTLGALADLGYGVDVSKADPFMILPQTNKIPVPKTSHPKIRCGNEGLKIR